MTIDNKSQSEAKLRQQIVETAENSQVSASQLESKLNEKIKTLDIQNDKCYQEIAGLKNQNADLVGQSEKLMQDIEVWKSKEQTANSLQKKSEQRIASLEQDIERLQESGTKSEADSQQAMSSL